MNATTAPLFAIGRGAGNRHARHSSPGTTAAARGHEKGHEADDGDSRHSAAPTGDIAADDAFVGGDEDFEEDAELVAEPLAAADLKAMSRPLHVFPCSCRICAK